MAKTGADNNAALPMPLFRTNRFPAPPVSCYNHTYGKKRPFPETDRPLRRLRFKPPVTIDSSIPSGCRTLIATLRDAVNGTPPDAPLDAADWPAVLRQAREQGVDTYLYPWLSANVPERFSAKAVVPGSAPAAWRELFLEALTQTLLRQRQLAEIFAAFAEAHIDVIALKGAWLSETVYADPAQRTMSDLDLLIRAEDRDACHTRLLALGYAVKTETLHNRYAYDQSYDHPRRRKHVELHWHVASDMISGTPIPDIASVWRNTSSAVCCGHPVRALSPADLLAHQIQHMLNHLFATPLRVYVDIALLVRKYGDELTTEALDAAGVRWKTGRGIPFVLRLASDLLAFPLPPALHAYAPELDAARRAQALQAVFDLPTAQARGGETTLVRFKASSPLGRLRLALARIFMPRPLLIMIYPYARHAYGLPFAWLRRAFDLRRNHLAKVKAMLTPGTAEEHLLGVAASRVDLTDWLRRG